MPSEVFPEAVIRSLFPKIDREKLELLASLEPIYQEMNAQINVISRNDMVHFNERHLIYSLTPALFYDLSDKEVVDVGTGGGFPGIPLAIMFPESRFTLVDSTRKKLKVVEEVVNRIGLKNVKTLHSRMEELDNTYDFMIGRAVTALPQLVTWGSHLVKWNRGRPESGMIYLKGGEFSEELNQLNLKHEVHELKDHLQGEYFETKKVIYLYVK